MSVKTMPIYQSGELVQVAGYYQVVGVEHDTPTSEATAQAFKRGDHFANYDGRAVCWHLIPATAVDEVPHNVDETSHTL
jgi:hypothetical protein